MGHVRFAQYRTGEPYIVMDDVSYRYPGAKCYALEGLNLTISKGEFVAILGEHGTGKSTFCQLLNGVIPNFQGGQMEGSVIVAGLNTQEVSVAELAQKVGIVLQDPEAQLFTTKVISEVAFGPENLCIEADEILERVRWALQVVRLTGFEERSPTSLSGGQKQRLAIAAALAMRPEVLVLDEATSQLDPVGTSEVLSVVRKLNQEYDVTIFMATHKSEEVAQFADRVLILHQGRLIAQGTPQEVFEREGLLRRAGIRPPQVSQLAIYLKERSLHLSEFPITTEQARRGIEQLLNSLPDMWRETRFFCRPNQASDCSLDVLECQTTLYQAKNLVSDIKVENLTYIYQPYGVVALEDVSFEVGKGEFVAIIGQNGAGKTTLLKNIVGLLKPTRGRMLVEGFDTRQTTVAELSRRVGLILQNPDQQLFSQTVEEEIAFGPRNLNLPDPEVVRRVEEAIAMLGLERFRQEFPLALAIGDRVRVVIASVLAMEPHIILLDEPTMGQDYRGHHQIMGIAKRLHQEGHTIVIATHHVDLVAEYAQRVIVLRKGKILLDDTPAAVFSQPEVLLRTHVAPPQITQLAQALPAYLGLPRNVLTVVELGEAVIGKLVNSVHHN